MKSLVVTLLMGVSFWLGMASQVRPAAVEFYRPAPPPKPVGYPMPCKPDDRVCREIANLKRARG